MSKFERDLRYNVKYGTSIPARVVDYFFGRASVVLSNNGALMRDLDVVGGQVYIGQAVRVDFTTSKPTVLANTTSSIYAAEAGGAFDTSEGGGGGGGGTVGEGPGIDIASNNVGFGGDSCLIYNSDGNPVEEFDATSAGLTAALAAMNAGDVLELPDWSISGGPWTISNGTMRGHSRYGTILRGGITVGNGCRLENLSVIREILLGTDIIYGVILGDGSRVSYCYIDVVSPAYSYGVYIAGSGTCYSNDNIVYAFISDSGAGYSFYSDGGNMYVTGGLAMATTAPCGGVGAL